MLYLVRKIDESIVINSNITVKVVEIKGKSVKLGFEFPPTAQVLRKEVYDRIVQENLAASQADKISDGDFSDAIAKVKLDKDTLKLPKQKEGDKTNSSDKN